MKLTGKLQTFDLTGEIGNGRRYILSSVNYGLLRTYFHCDLYDPFTQQGEQRVARKRHVQKLRSAISGGDYTPAAFYACVDDLSRVNVDDKGNVEIPLAESKKLPILDGGSRLAALEIIHSECDIELSRRVENLPIPLMVYLDPDHRKNDFVKLQLGLPLSRSQLLSMNIDQGQVNKDKEKALILAREITYLLHKDEKSPFYEQINFGNVEGGKLSFNTLMSVRAGDIAGSIYGSSQITIALEKDRKWFLDSLVWMTDFVKNNTKGTERGKLLELPPAGARGCAHNLVGITNVWNYYLYLRELEKPEQSDLDLLRESLLVYDQDINKDLSSGRKKTLLCGFSQRLFSSLSEDNEVMTGFHFGLPITLLVLTNGGASFGVENPPNVTTRRNRKSKSLLVEQVETIKVDSDTVDGFDDE